MLIFHACDAAQDILDGEPTLVGEGRVRRVYVAEHEGRKVAVKELTQRENIRLHRLEVITLDEVRSPMAGSCAPRLLDTLSTSTGACVRNFHGMGRVFYPLRCMSWNVSKFEIGSALSPSTVVTRFQFDCAFHRRFRSSSFLQQSNPLGACAFAKVFPASTPDSAPLHARRAMACE